MLFPHLLVLLIVLMELLLHFSKLPIEIRDLPLLLAHRGLCTHQLLLRLQLFVLLLLSQVALLHQLILEFIYLFIRLFDLYRLIIDLIQQLALI